MSQELWSSGAPARSSCGLFRPEDAQLGPDWGSNIHYVWYGTKRGGTHPEPTLLDTLGPNLLRVLFLHKEQENPLPSQNTWALSLHRVGKGRPLGLACARTTSSTPGPRHQCSDLHKLSCLLSRNTRMPGTETPAFPWTLGLGEKTPSIRA